ncbi:MFS transporter [Methylobacillus gramineus]|uniref:MFS transporter n=1 Tax=Methylobacillus gramineus TaxID=755169 RepID=UPI001CFF6578|nr:MFS transporter [Methylobacillus gramineus]MCB5186022.1 MFS transporter [Methylobacillus gramineus]
MSPSERMSAIELRATLGLASIYGLRMLGMFLILPIFAIYAETLPEGHDHFYIGLALGAYGLTQAIFQLPFGMASDRFGRKNMIYIGLLIFAAGSFVAASATDIHMVIIGRAIQGAGAVSAAVTAMVADLTREEHRTKAMAMIGGTIGITFALSLILGPTLNQWIGVPGIFALTGFLALLAILDIKYLVPNPQVSRFHSDTQAAPAKLSSVLKNTQLLRLNFGIFALHASHMAMFVVVPFAIKQTSGMSENDHWMIYLPIMVISLALMVPAIIYGEKKAKLKQVFIATVLTMLVAEIAFGLLIDSFWGIVASLTIFFIAFNVLEAIMPSTISKQAPAAAKGTAIGVFNTAQSLGIFVGAVSGGFLSGHFGYSSVFVFCGILMLLWLISVLTMQPPAAVKSKMYHLPEGYARDAAQLSRQLAALPGVRESVVLPAEGMVILKVDMQVSWDESAALQLIRG